MALSWQNWSLGAWPVGRLSTWSVNAVDKLERWFPKLERWLVGALLEVVAVPQIAMQQLLCLAALRSGLMAIGVSPLSRKFNASIDNLIFLSTHVLSSRLRVFLVRGSGLLDLVGSECPQSHRTDLSRQQNAAIAAVKWAFDVFYDGFFR